MYEGGYINRSSHYVLQNTYKCRRSVTSYEVCRSYAETLNLTGILLSSCPSKYMIVLKIYELKCPLKKRGIPHTTLKLPMGICFIARHNAGYSEVSYLLTAIVFLMTGAAFNCVLVNSAFFDVYHELRMRWK